MTALHVSIEARSFTRQRALRSATLAGVLLLTLSASSAQARDLYFTAITVLGNTVGASTNKLQQVADFYDNDRLSDLFPGYVPDSIAVGATLNLRGVAAEIAYDTSSTALRFTLGSKSVTLDSGTSRDETAELFEDWLQGAAEGIGNLTVTDLLQSLVELSPVDPVAGNPNSLQSKMAFADYGMGTRSPLLGETHSGEDLFGIGANSGPFSGCVSSGCMDVVTVDLRLALSIWGWATTTSTASSTPARSSTVPSRPPSTAGISPNHGWTI